MNPSLIFAALAWVGAIAFACIARTERRRANNAEQELAEYRLGEAERLARALDAQARAPRGGGKV